MEQTFPGTGEHLSRTGRNRWTPTAASARCVIHCLAARKRARRHQSRRATGREQVSRYRRRLYRRNRHRQTPVPTGPSPPAIPPGRGPLCAFTTTAARHQGALLLVMTALPWKAQKATAFNADLASSANDHENFHHQRRRDTDRANGWFSQLACWSSRSLWACSMVSRGIFRHCQRRQWHWQQGA